MAREVDLRIILRAVNRASEPLGRVSRAVGRIGESANKAGRLLRGIGGGIKSIGTAALTRITAPIAAISGLALTASGFVEQLTTGFESMLGSSKAARDMVERLAEFAASTPFELKDLGTATKQLLAFGVDSDETIATLKLLGDVAAGAGVPLADLGQIYGKTLSKGKAQTEELNQLSERGVPIMQALVDLAAKYGNIISKEDVYDAAEKGTITFETMKKALTLLVSEGGIFEGQMEKQSQTLFGLASTLKDNVFNALVKVGDKLVDVFQVKEGMRKLIEWIGDATKRFVEFADTNPELTRFLFIFAGVVAVAGPVLIALGLAVVAAGGLVTAFGTLAGAVAALLSPFGLLAAGAALAAYLIYLNWDGIVEWMQKLWRGISDALDIDDLVTRIKAADVSGAVRGWFTNLADKVGSLWDGVTGAFDVAGLLTSIEGAGVAGGILGWLRGIGDDLAPLWTDVTSAFDIKALVAAVQEAGIADAVLGWLTGLSDKVKPLWAKVTSAFSVDNLLERLKGADIFGTVEGWLTGLSDKVKPLWAKVTSAFSVDNLLERLKGAGHLRHRRGVAHGTLGQGEAAVGEGDERVQCRQPPGAAQGRGHLRHRRGVAHGTLGQGEAAVGEGDERVQCRQPPGAAQGARTSSAPSRGGSRDSRTR